jgi:predicted RNA-binding protein (virulence factor B family)
MDEDAEAVMKLIVDAYGGKLPFDDKADPERIREVTGLSKAAFKRAVGKLYREHRVLIEDGCIRCV